MGAIPAQPGLTAGAEGERLLLQWGMSLSETPLRAIPPWNLANSVLDRRTWILTFRLPAGPHRIGRIFHLSPVWDLVLADGQSNPSQARS